MKLPTVPRIAPALAAGLVSTVIVALFGIAAGPTIPLLAAPATALQELPVVRAIVLAQLGGLPAPDTNCTPNGQDRLRSQTYPTGGLEPEFPAWCYAKPVAGAPTRIQDTNSWRDTWDNTGSPMQALVDHAYNYRVFPVFYGGPFTWSGFINADHWMLDLVDSSPFRLSGGVLVSPDRAFHFENGRFVVEVDAAAGAPGMGGADHFYEIDFSPSPEIADHGVDTLYGYGSFSAFEDVTKRQYAMGVRLEGSNFVVAMYDNSGRDTGGRCMTTTPCTGPQRPGRVWETQGVGTPRTASSVQGGYLDWPIPNSGGLRLRDVMRVCAANEHDLHCRDRFRVELTRDSIHVLVNGYSAMLIDGLYAVNPFTGADNRIPASWLDPNGIGVRPYFTSWINSGQHAPARWHWNEVNVNPHNADGSPAAPSKAPSFCLNAAPIPNVTRNTCPHQHVPGGPEVPVAGQAGGTAVPTLPPATATAVSATATAVAATSTAVAATATALATMTPQPTATPVPATATPVVLPRDCAISIAADGSVSGQCQ